MKGNILLDTDKKRKILAGIVIIVFLAVLGVLALFAVKNHWFERRQSAEAESVEGIPDYSGTDVIILNDNKPSFTAEEIESITGENYSSLDALGRCGPAIARLDYSMMPTEERGDIGDIRPSGWNQEKYPGIVNSEPPYLYNRCHLIAFMFTGQNANPENLITGTRYFNSELMLPYENQVAQYLYDEDTPDRNGEYKHVLYRVTPYFKDAELVARGVEMEAYSVEDSGKSLSFHVFIYNVQPGIEINYLTGESRVAD